MDCKKIDVSGLVASFPPEKWQPAAVAFLTKLPSDATIGVACSGGADSVALLLLVYACFPEMRERLLVLHFDHKLRGKDSADDAAFVADIAQQLGLRCVQGERTDGLAVASVGEVDARNARMGFFGESLGNDRNPDKYLLTGHHADDLAETMLIRLSRGSGTEGLCAPRPVSKGLHGITFIRPLLTFSASFIREKLSLHHVAWREDITNNEDGFQRNRLRHHMLPLWQSLTDHPLAHGINRSRMLLEEDADALNGFAGQLFRDASELSDAMNVRVLKGHSRAVLRRVLNLFLERNKLHDHLSSVAKESILNGLCRSGDGISGSWSCGTEKQLRLSESLLVLEPLSPKVFRLDAQCCDRDGSMALSDGSVLTVKTVEMHPGLREAIFAGHISCGERVFLNVSLPLFIRSRQAGDAYCPLGSPGTQSVQDLFVNRKIPLEMRDRLPVIFSSEGDILWIPGLPPAESARILQDTMISIELTYTPFL